VQPKKLTREGGSNYIKVVNPIVKGRKNRKGLGENLLFFVVYPTAMAETVLAVKKTHKRAIFLFCTTRFRNNTHLLL